METQDLEVLDCSTATAYTSRSCEGWAQQEGEEQQTQVILAPSLAPHTVMPWRSQKTRIHLPTPSIWGSDTSLSPQAIVELLLETTVA